MPSIRPFLSALALLAGCLNLNAYPLPCSDPASNPHDCTKDDGGVDAAGPATDRAPDALGAGGTGGAAPPLDGPVSGAGGSSGSGGSAPAPVVDALAPIDMMMVTPPPPQPDALPGCMSTCILGKSRCSSGGVQTCLVLTDGCAGWGPLAACPAPQTCPADGEKCECPKVVGCTKKGDQQCTSAGLQKCEMDGVCLNWGPAANCPAPQTCTSNKCECPKGGSSCSKEGDHKCGTSEGLQTCAKDGACFAWSAEKACTGARERCMGGSCTAACPVQSKANLVPNAGFDQGLGGWTGDLGGEDASGCPTSKSVLMVGTPGDDGGILPGNSLSPCFMMAAGQRYSFGATMKRNSGSKVTCFVLTWADATSCKDNAGTSNRLESIDNSLAPLNQWDRQSVEIAAQISPVWARVNCRADGKGLADEVFVTPAPGGF